MLKPITGCLLIISSLLSAKLSADHVILDDLIVDGSACIGFDCVNGESFGFDTIRLKENNLRIGINDTSTAASFPRNDWQLVFNDSANGGVSKFSVVDDSNNRTPFTLEARAPSHSLYVDDGGRVGMGTSTPSTNIHTVDGDTPSLRLQQDGSSGFAPQTWDVAGNETNFFVRDVSNGSTLPLRIRPGAPSSAIDIDDNGNIGMGTASPNGPLHIERASGPYITLKNSATNQIWYLTHETNNNHDFYITKENAGVPQGQAFKLTGSGNLSIAGTITTAGSCSSGCDLVFTKDYDLPTIEQHAAQMWKNKHLPAVGPTPEEGRFNLTEKTGGMLNELEKAHIYIEQLNNAIKKLTKHSEQQEVQIKKLSIALNSISKQ